MIMIECIPLIMLNSSVNLAPDVGSVTSTKLCEFDNPQVGVLAVSSNKNTSNKKAEFLGVMQHKNRFLQIRRTSNKNKLK